MKPRWSVICLCAAWCSACREYRAVFDALAARHPDVEFRWLDVEDEEELVGDLDVETFPTLLVAEGSQPRFLGPLAPHGRVLERLLASLREAPGPAKVASDADIALLGRIQAPKGGTYLAKDRAAS
ncbi:MAG: thioredoxin family protein [Pseudomonadota bacterium]